MFKSFALVQVRRCKNGSSDVIFRDYLFGRENAGLTALAGTTSFKGSLTLFERCLTAG